MGLVEVIEAFIAPVRHLCIVYFDFNGRAAISGEENIMSSHNVE